MNKNKIILSGILAASLLTSCGNNTKEDVMKVGLITLHDSNSTYDKNFIDAMSQACSEEKVEMVLRTGIDETQSCYNTASELADGGCKLIFADSFGHETFLINAAKEFTNVEFAHATGTQSKQVNLPNYHNAFANIYQGRYLAGVAAGAKLQEMIDENTLPSTAKKDENGNYILGYVGAYTYAEVISGYTSWYLGVKSVVENVTMNVQFTGSWYDEVAEKEAAIALINSGAAIISQHADSMGAPSACEAAKVPNVSYNGSTEESCHNTFVVSSRINWVPYFKYIIQSVKEGKKFDTDWCGTLENNTVQLTNYGSAAAKNTKELVDNAMSKINDGSLKVFDTSKFTVSGQVLTEYLADVDGDYTGEVNVIRNDYFDESNAAEFRSAPYFDLKIDGITLLNNKF